MIFQDMSLVHFGALKKKERVVTVAAKVISIEIGYYITRICEVDFKAKVQKIYNHCSIPTPEGVISDGVVEATPEFANAIKSALMKNHMKSKQVVFSVMSTKIASREALIPNVKENRIADVVAANASEYFPVDLSNFKVAYSVLGTTGSDAAAKIKLMVLAAPLNLIQSYYALASMLKLEIVAIDYGVNSLFQIIAGKCDSGNNLVIKVDDNSSVVLVDNNKTITFSRSVPYGIGEAMQTMVESGEYGVFPTVLEAQKFAQTTDTTGDAEIEDSLSPLLDGIERVVDFYLSRNSEANIDNVILTGVGADFAGLPEKIASRLRRDVLIATELSGIDFEKHFGSSFYNQFLSTIGAGIAPIDLKTDDGQKKGLSTKSMDKGGKNDDSAFKIGLIVGIFGAVLGLIFAGMGMMEYFPAVKENLRLTKEYNDLQTVVPIYEEYLTTRDAYDKVKAMYAVTENRNEELVEFLEELELKLPSDVVISSLSSDKEMVSITMKVGTKSEAAAVVQNLRTFDSLDEKSVDVASLTVEFDEEEVAIGVEFTVSANYRPVGYEETTEETQE